MSDSAVAVRELDPGRIQATLAHIIVSKVAAVHAQHRNDSAVQGAVDQVEMLCTGLSRRIWQKIMLIPQAEPAPRRDPVG